MSTQSKLQWVSCLALALLAASCSGMAGSPIQEDNLDAAASDGPMPQDSAEKAADFRPAFFDVFTEDSNLSGNIPTQLGNLSAGDKSVSYTPGATCAIGAGVMTPSVLNYGWMGGVVTEGAAAPYVKLTSNVGTPLAWVIYGYKELVAGRLQKITVAGSGKQCAFVMYNWNTATWDYLGTYDLTLALPVTFVVNPPHAPNGLTYFAAIQLSPNETTINRIKTEVF